MCGMGAPICPPRIGPPETKYVLRVGGTRVPALAQGGVHSFLRQFVSGEEITWLETRRVFGVGTVQRVLLDARRPLFADGAIVGLRRISGAHQFALVGDSVFL